MGGGAIWRYTMGGEAIMTSTPQPTIEEQIELVKLLDRARIFMGEQVDVLAAILATLRRVRDMEKDAARYRMAQENLCGSDHEARHHMDDALDEQIAALASNDGGAK